MKILITGASGFIGSNILKALIKENHEITVVASTHTENPIPKGCKVVYLGLEGLNWKEAYGKDAIIHQAANNDTLFQDAGEMYRANVYGPIRLFHHAKDGGCRKFVYASSTAVYGDQPAPYQEDSTLVKPLNVYGETKAKFDNFAMEFAEQYNVECVGFRYCNVYGPGEDHKGKRASMIYQLIQQLTLNSPVNRRVATLFKDGKQKRDWIHVDDVVGANMTALHSNVSGIFNCGTGVATSFNRLVEIIKELSPDIMAKFMEIEYVENPHKDAYQNHTECDIKKMREELGFSPHFDIENGIKAYLKKLAVL
jgi:ADP-L-glycero-D-manno-heptose 6-epimerase